MKNQARHLLLSGIAGMGITTAIVAQPATPQEKPKPVQTKVEPPASASNASAQRIVIRGGEELPISGKFNGTLELNNVTVNELIGLMEKMRTEEDEHTTYVIREEAGDIVLPRIVTQKKGLKEILENLPSIEPKLGVEQLPQGGYVILSREITAPKEEKTFAAFGLKEYLNRLAGSQKISETEIAKVEKLRQEAIHEIQVLIEDAFELQSRESKDKTKPKVSIRIHQSTGVLLATGTPKELAMIRTTLQALGIPGSISGASSQDWGPPRGGSWVPSTGGMMGGGMGGGGSMGGGFGSMGVMPTLPSLPSSGGFPASPTPGLPNSIPYGGGGLPSAAPAATSPAKPAAAPKKPGATAPATPAAPTAPAKPGSPVDGDPQVVSPERP